MATIRDGVKIRFSLLLLLVLVLLGPRKALADTPDPDFEKKAKTAFSKIKAKVVDEQDGQVRGALPDLARLMFRADTHIISSLCQALKKKPKELCQELSGPGPIPMGDCKRVAQACRDIANSSTPTSDADCKAIERYGNNCSSAVSGAGSHIWFKAAGADRWFIPYVATNSPRKSKVTKVIFRISTPRNKWNLTSRSHRSFMLKQYARISGEYPKKAVVKVVVRDMAGDPMVELIMKSGRPIFMGLADLKAEQKKQKRERDIESVDNRFRGNWIAESMSTNKGEDGISLRPNRLMCEMKDDSILMVTGDELKLKRVTETEDGAGNLINVAYLNNDNAWAMTELGDTGKILLQVMLVPSMEEKRRFVIKIRKSKKEPPPALRDLRDLLDREKPIQVFDLLDLGEQFK